MNKLKFTVMKFHLSLFLAFQTLLSFSQKQYSSEEIHQLPLFQKHSTYTFSSAPQSTKVQDVEGFLESEYQLELKSEFVKTSPVAHYYLFQQTHLNRDVYSAEINQAL